MNSPDDSVEIPFDSTNIEEASDPSPGSNTTAEVPPAVTQAFSGDTKDTAVSNVTFVGSAGGVSKGTAAAANHTERTEGGTRKINRQDVRQIFRASTTTGAVTIEQVQRIKKMHDKISEGVDMDFNYSCLLMVASVVAGLGLALDSSTTVISSMLLSPIMGPVIGMSYGLCVWDLPLIKRSARNEIISVVICVIFGVIIGACCSWTPMAETWPTNEMLSRGTRTTFLCGFPIAFFSGLGVALSVLDDQTSSLVGVAISASLLPPAVNCGMMFVVAAIKGEDFSNFTFQIESESETIIKTEQAIIDYLENRYPDFSQMGIMSLLLTVANVIMVALGATLMFRAKEVLPVKKKVFWHDLKIARRIYQGRAVDPVTGEPLTAQDLLLALYAAEENGNIMGQASTDVVSKHSTGINSTVVNQTQ